MQAVMMLDCISGDFVSGLAVLIQLVQFNRQMKKYIVSLKNGIWYIEYNFIKSRLYTCTR